MLSLIILATCQAKSKGVYFLRSLMLCADKNFKTQVSEEDDMSTLAEELILSLKKLGVHYVFGIPGGPSIPYMEAMRKHNMEFVLTANEQSAAIMAGMFGVLTGTPGVCHATFGPGATNLATGVGGALLDRLPLMSWFCAFN